MRLLKGELIGKDAEVLESKNKSLVGLKGKIVDETKSTITIRCGKPKKVMKNIVTLKIGDYKVSGRLLMQRPEERIKAKHRS